MDSSLRPMENSCGDLNENGLIGPGVMAQPLKARLTTKNTREWSHRYTVPMLSHQVVALFKKN